MGNSSIDRRDLLRGVAALGASGLLYGQEGEMKYRTLGQTGEKVSILGLGGFHIGKPPLDEQDAIRIIRTALDHGLNFMDNSWDYNGGQSEIRVGKALRDGYRQKAFLMTKIDGRTRQEAARQIDESLRRLQTDHVDLLQHHEVIRFEDPDRIFAPDGSIEAFLDAKKAGKLRYIGFTGHKDPHVHLYMLEVAKEHGFRFDTVQMPLNVMDAHFRSFEKLVLPELERQDIGVLGMKSMGSGVILESHTASPVECLHYALSLPTSVVITGIDSDQVLHQAFEVIRTFRPMPAKQISALLAKTAAAAARGRYELFKTTAHFDSTAHNPQWLGGETPRTKELVENANT
jgi:aryl-alcohol dehydrogenase-like predicted oxidoreductase